MLRIWDFPSRKMGILLFGRLGEDFVIWCVTYKHLHSNEGTYCHDFCYSDLFFTSLRLVVLRLGAIRFLF